MKKIVAVILGVLCIGCERKIDIVDPLAGFSEEIRKILPEDILNSMRSKGMVVHEGVAPPYLEGIYLMDPFELLNPYGPEDSWQKGYIIPGYQFKFSNQSNDKKAVKIDYTNYPNGGSDVGNGLGAFVSGYGRKFTVFAELSGTLNGIDYIALSVFSGEMTENNEIKDFQQAYYMKEKGENPGPGKLMPVNTGRIWFDNDRISQRMNEYYGGIRSGRKAGNGVSASFAGTDRWVQSK